VMNRPAGRPLAAGVAWIAPGSQVRVLPCAGPARPNMTQGGEPESRRGWTCIAGSHSKALEPQNFCGFLALGRPAAGLRSANLDYWRVSQYLRHFATRPGNGLPQRMVSPKESPVVGSSFTKGSGGKRLVWQQASKIDG
jgi:hypothetical protein